ncbi:MAG: membrane protein insertion efficiency factor YidD [Deltaproteobacteria bacterium]|nr:membrane protein insertion efficiency factor YidD [Deltaproteobacteria bacterium]
MWSETLNSSFAKPENWSPPKRRLLNRAALGLIRLYQLLISPILPAACRYQPTCSEYAAECFAHENVVRALWLTVRRLSRCHPWGGHGYDPPPCRHHRHGDEGHAHGSPDVHEKSADASKASASPALTPAPTQISTQTSTQIPTQTSTQILIQRLPRHG